MITLLILFLGAVLILFAGVSKMESKLNWLMMVILTVALAFTVLEFTGLMSIQLPEKYVPPDMLFFNRISQSFSIILILAALLTTGLFKNQTQHGSDLQGLLLFSLCGGLIMVAFNHLVILFIGLEALSIPLYVLAGSNKASLKGNEAAIKYFLMGAFSSSVFLLGCAFIYGATGGLDMMTLYFTAEKMAHLHSVSTLMSVGISLILVGLCFKISAVPFHFWSPDVYEGSPNRTTVFMATIVKIAAFAACFRLFSLVLGELKSENWGMILAVISGLTIIVGNVGALVQKSVKRTLAYSSVAHAGYMILGLLAASQAVGEFRFPVTGHQGLVIYALGYVCATAIIFYFFNKLSVGGDESFEAFSGLGKNNKWAGLLVGLSMFSLAGIPLTAGFAGKYTLFSSAFSEYSWLVLIALLGSAVSIGYYFRIFKNVFFSEGEASVDTKPMETVLLALAGILILIAGILPGLVTGVNYLK